MTLAPDGVVRATRAMALASLIGLIVLGLAWELWLAPTGNGSLALKVVPLLVPVLGLWRHRLYTYRWVSLLVWLYATEGLVRVGSDRGLSQLLAGLEVLLCVVLFIACTIHIRLRLKAARAALAASHPSGEAP